MSDLYAVMLAKSFSSLSVEVLGVEHPLSDTSKLGPDYWIPVFKTREAAEAMYPGAEIMGLGNKTPKKEAL